MSALLPCLKVCPPGRVVIVGPYVPNPLITVYKPFDVPRKIINTCPTITAGPFCPPWWFFRAHGFDEFVESEGSPAPDEPIDFPNNPSTLAKIEVFWYEYGESARSNKGSSTFGPGPVASGKGITSFAGQSLVNTGGHVNNRVVMDIGTGVNISIPPSARIFARILVPDVDTFLENNILPENDLPTTKIGYTRVTPSGFLTDETLGYPSAKLTQSVFVDSEDQPTQVLDMPPLARDITVYLADPEQGPPRVEFLFKREIPVVLASIDGAICNCPKPENAEVIRVVSNGYSGIVTIVCTLDV